MTLTYTMLTLAAMQALRHWLFELGHDEEPVAPAEGALRGVYYLPSVRRLVHVRAAIAPSQPERLTAAEIRALHRLAPRFGARAWEAHVIVRSNYHPSAIIWRPLPPAGIHHGLNK
jgi:hypothetical protein